MLHDVLTMILIIWIFLLFPSQGCSCYMMFMPHGFFTMYLLLPLYGCSCYRSMQQTCLCKLCLILSSSDASCFMPGEKATLALYERATQTEWAKDGTHIAFYLYTGFGVKLFPRNLCCSCTTACCHLFGGLDICCAGEEHKPMMRV